LKDTKLLYMQTTADNYLHRKEHEINIKVIFLVCLFVLYFLWVLRRLSLVLMDK